MGSDDEIGGELYSGVDITDVLMLIAADPPPRLDRLRINAFGKPAAAIDIFPCMSLSDVLLCMSLSDVLPCVAAVDICPDARRTCPFLLLLPPPPPIPSPPPFPFPPPHRGFRNIGNSPATPPPPFAFCCPFPFSPLPPCTNPISPPAPALKLRLCPYGCPPPPAPALATRSCPSPKSGTHAYTRTSYPQPLRGVHGLVQRARRDEHAARNGTPALEARICVLSTARVV
ncbi:hypothetical protein B0H14DRAFT_3432978 [Mycena olivaceomarginata]|nr:hypothetical protein B0H14DRAFT_3432978 [Mycena olivaceomarginata]